MRRARGAARRRRTATTTATVPTLPADPLPSPTRRPAPPSTSRTSCRRGSACLASRLPPEGEEGGLAAARRGQLWVLPRSAQRPAVAAELLERPLRAMPAAAPATCQPLPVPLLQLRAPALQHWRRQRRRHRPSRRTTACRHTERWEAEAAALPGSCAMGPFHPPEATLRRSRPHALLPRRVCLHLRPRTAPHLVTLASPVMAAAASPSGPQGPGAAAVVGTCSLGAALLALAQQHSAPAGGAPATLPRPPSSRHWSAAAAAATAARAALAGSQAAAVPTTSRGAGGLRRHCLAPRP